MGSSKAFDGQAEMFVLDSLSDTHFSTTLQRASYGLIGAGVLSTMSGAIGPGETLEDRVGPLVEGGELKRLEGADGQTGEREREEEGMKRRGEVSQ